jgi:hypothetical protein
MEDIDDYNKLGDMEKQLYDVAMQIQMMDQFSARQNEAIMSLLKLRNYYGVTEDEILNLYKFFEKHRSKISVESLASPNPSRIVYWEAVIFLSRWI